MAADTALCMALIGACAALPAVFAHRTRAASQRASDTAHSLAELARELRAGFAVAVEPPVLAAVEHLPLPERVGFLFAVTSPAAGPELRADVAQRLATRLRRHVAFDRKMLARTAAGRRRGAIAAALPAAALPALGAAGVDVPGSALVVLVALEVLGCALLSRCAHVEY